ncbi:MAG: peptide chain release factor N(5)-glutamine methyltransferase [Ardenticatenaceae bacterium]|nr:peptide chain release factor N(5)-glutamine methyltransferase [Ardenticatenaceae bacterium]
MSETDPVTIGEALHIGRQMIPPLEARLLLEAVVNRPATWLIAHDKDAFAAEQWTRYRSFLQRAADGEPIPYITGRAMFYGRPFVVNQQVLIPRPETEELVEKALKAASQFDRPHIVDVGTGSGCIAVTLGCELTIFGAVVTAVDSSESALAIARKNWRQLAPTNSRTRLSFGVSDLLDRVAGPIHLLIANLPYVTDEEFDALDPSVRGFEPPHALRGGSDGLNLIKQLLQQATQLMAPKGIILLEIGWQQGESAQKLARSYFPQAAVILHKDLANRDRIVEVRLQ